MGKEKGIFCSQTEQKDSQSILNQIASVFVDIQIKTGCKNWSYLHFGNMHPGTNNKGESSQSSNILCRNSSSKNGICLIFTVHSEVHCEN